MVTLKFPVPAGTTRVRFRPPNHESVPSAGPYHIELSPGWTREFTPIQGGPCQVTVVRVNAPRAGQQWVTLDIEGATVSLEPVFIGKKIAQA